jgi:hypothetical protein
MSIPFKCNYVVVSPVDQATVPNNTLFVDSTMGNVFSVKNNSGSASTLGTTVGDNPFLKTMQSDGIFSAYVPIVKLTNGRVVLADANNINAESFCGYSMVASLAAGQSVNVMTIGPTVVGALTGLGFAPGDTIYINENGGYTNDPGTFTGGNDTLVKVGIADCTGGAVASPVADDLIAAYEFIAGVLSVSYNYYRAHSEAWV